MYFYTYAHHRVHTVRKLVVQGRPGESLHLGLGQTSLGNNKFCEGHDLNKLKQLTQQILKQIL